MLILLPPSEGKASPARGKPLDLGRLSSPALTEARRQVLGTLIELCTGGGEQDTAEAKQVVLERAAQVLGLGPTQHDLVARNAALATAPTARADRVYTGVVFDHLDFATLSTGAKRRANSRVAVTSSLFGIVRPNDPIPSYRLSGDVTLPGLGSVAGFWREHLGPAIEVASGSGLLVDLRSGTYAAFWRPPAEWAPRLATVRVLQEVDGVRKVVSHFNKATKGRLVRQLLEDGRNPRTPGGLADLLTELGWHVETEDLGAKGTRIDVVVTEL